MMIHCFRITASLPLVRNNAYIKFIEEIMGTWQRFAISVVVILSFIGSTWFI